MISEKDVEKLALLSRLELSMDEKKKLAHDMSSILSYVDKLKKAPVNLDEKPVVGDTRNVLRDDVVLHEPSAFTEALLSLAPKREGKYVKVKKVL